MSNKHLKLLFKSILTICIMGYIFSILDFQLLWKGAQKISLTVLLEASFFCFFCLLCQALRWCYLSKAHLTHSMRYQALLFWKASLFSLITPASLGGDLYRVMSTKKLKKSTTTFALIIKERALGLIGLFICYLLFLNIYFIKAFPLNSLFLAIGIIALLALPALILMPKFVPLLMKLLSPYLGLGWKKKIISFSRASGYQSKSEFLVLVLLTIASFISWVMAYYILSQAIYPIISLEKLGLVSLTTELARWLPITIQGVGVREGVAAYIFRLLGFSVETGFLIAGLVYCINTLVIILMGTLSFVLTSSTHYFSYRLRQLSAQ